MFNFSSSEISAWSLYSLGILVKASIGIGNPDFGKSDLAPRTASLAFPDSWGTGIKQFLKFVDLSFKDFLNF